MALDTGTRNILARAVGRSRDLLVASVDRRMQQEYGLQPDGDRLDMDQLQHLDERGLRRAEILRQWQDHLATLESGSDQNRLALAFARMAYETSFTTLNRLVALRMCEERDYMVECVRRGLESEGFRLFEQLSGGALGGRTAAYRSFLTAVFRELAVELGVLFDPDAPQSVVFPDETCLQEVLAELTSEDLSDVWDEDETIGWVFQYFNSDDERKAMRKAASAPRNSRELAVRNQFFTPRYVVEFLVDNTLGRIWYEMRQGSTRLAEECRYLVHRPTEVFLTLGEPVPDDEADGIDLSREDLLQLPAYISWRDKRDPRDFQVVDPACGSGHFLLYAFDVLASIYEEAWEDESSPSSAATGATLRDDYPELGALRSAIPRLVIERNLYGVDIDPRTAQVAALALWLRAQRFGRDADVELQPITKTNVVCAEPMPGDARLLTDFTHTLQPEALRQLTVAFADLLRPAGELGVLLKAEEQLCRLIDTARDQWAAANAQKQMVLAPELEMPSARQPELFDVSGITDDQFWATAETRILDGLRAYAAQVEVESGMRRRLFSDDAGQGLAFVDLCRQRFDVVLMNPPFGEPAKGSKAYVDKTYLRTKNDLYAAFVERGLEMLVPRGRLGAITSRTGFFLSSFQKWREEILLRETEIGVFADLGYGVLDANVETAAYCLERRVP